MLPRKPFLFVALVAFSLSSASRVALAQNGRCPAVTRGSQYDLDSVAEVFESAEWSESRKHMKIEQVTATAIKRYVVNDSVCQALYRATVQALPKVYGHCEDSACRSSTHMTPAQAELYLSDHSLFYFRIGDYYAVLPVLNRPVRGYWTLFIFRVPASQGGHNDPVGRILQFLGMGDSRELKFLGAPMI